MTITISLVSYALYNDMKKRNVNQIFVKFFDMKQYNCCDPLVIWGRDNMKHLSQK